MHISANSVYSARDMTPSESDLIWFVTRQPGVVRFLTDRIDGDDALATAISGAWTIASAYSCDEQLPAPRLDHRGLRHAEISVARELATTAVLDGLAHRQPHVTQFVGELANDPPAPLTTGQRQTVFETLLAVTYALDEQVSGRPM